MPKPCRHHITEFKFKVALDAAKGQVGAFIHPDGQAQH